MFLLGVNLPDDKLVHIALTRIHGIGRTSAQRLCSQLLIHPHCRLRELPEAHLTALSQALNGMRIEAELRKQTATDIQRLVQIGAYKGLRHKAGLPANGQRTRSNARTAERLNGKGLPTAANTTGAAAAVTPPSRRSLRRRGGATAAGASSAPPRPQRHAAIKSISVLDHNSDTKHDDHASASASTPPSRLWSIATFLLRAFLLGLGCPPPYNVTGFVAPEFEPVRTAFSKNFEIGDEVGASFVAYVDGEPIAELYGGFADPHVFQKPYSPDTLQLIFSSSKAITSIAVLRMVDLGLLDLHAPVARYWPEFAANGKENVTVRDVLMHRAGVSYLDIDRVPTPLEVVDMDGMAARLAEQKHAFGGEPRSAYHAVTRGWYLNEIVRRVDPQGRSLRRIMNEDIIPLISTGAPPGAPYEFHYGFSRDELPRLAPRVAPLDGFSIAFMTYSALMPAAGHRWLGTEPAPRVVLELAKPWSVSTRSLVLSVPRSAVPSWPHAFNRHAIWLGEGPSYNGITNART
ncbi:hypothetical protein HK405_003601, partial [Cladochytrium tenue]